MPKVAAAQEALSMPGVNLCGIFMHFLWSGCTQMLSVKSQVRKHLSSYSTNSLKVVNKFLHYFPNKFLLVFSKTTSTSSFQNKFHS